MSRGVALGAILWLLVAALTLQAEPATTAPRIGFVEAGSRSANQHLLDAFRRGLRDFPERARSAARNILRGI